MNWEKFSCVRRGLQSRSTMVRAKCWNDATETTSRTVTLFEHSGFIRYSSFALRRLVSPTLPGVAHGRQAFAKVRLLAVGFSLLIRLARLLFRAGARTSTAWQCYKEHRNEKCRGR